MRRLHKALLMPWTNKVNYTQIVQQIAPANLIQYLILGEPVGATVALDSSGNGRTGAYSNVSLGQPGIGDGQTAAGMVAASSSFCNIYTTSFNTAWTGGEFTIAGWAKVSAVGVWTDATSRCLIRIRRSGSADRIDFLKSTASNEIDTTYVAGGVTKTVGIASFSPTAYFHIGVTASASADQYKLYINGVQSGATATGLGVWGGVLDSTQCCLASVSTSGNTLWSGNQAHWAVWSAPLSAAQMLTLAAVP